MLIKFTDYLKFKDVDFIEFGTKFAINRKISNSINLVLCYRYKTNEIFLIDIDTGYQKYSSIKREEIFSLGSIEKESIKKIIGSKRTFDRLYIETDKVMEPKGIVNRFEIMDLG